MTTGPGARHTDPAAPPPLVLLVEDDEMLRRTTALVLERQGFATAVAGDGIDALELLDQAAQPPDAAVIDVMMPRMDGVTLTRRLRQRDDTAELPVIILTARDLPHDQLAGFDAGADDYVVKPFDGDVLAARLRAVLRRGHSSARQEPVERVGDLVIDRAGMTVHRDGVEAGLSVTEFRLLEVLLDHRGAVLSRSQLLDHVWGLGDWADGHVVEVTVQRLRGKIGPGHIGTVRGVGYKLVG